MRQSEATYSSNEKPYLEACCQNIQSYKKYLERTRPHRNAVVESIYKNSQFIAASTCEIVTLITSRYLNKTDDNNAKTLKKLVIDTILQCFSAKLRTEYESACQADEAARADPNTQRTVSQTIAAAIRTFVKKMHQRFINAIFIATERTIRSLGQRICSIQEKDTKQDNKSGEMPLHEPDCLFSCDFELYQEKLRISPGEDEIKGAFETLL